ncbi:MAG: toxic anion resistance protein [Pseudomonadota bacterium]
MATVESLKQQAGELAEIDEAATTAARATIDPAVGDSITYFGVKAQREAARLTDQMAQTGQSDTVSRATELLGRMLDRIKAAAPTEAPQGFFSRLLKREPKALGGAKLKELEVEIDQIAGDLEGCSNPLMTETLLLERRETALREATLDLGAHVRAGLTALDELEGQSAHYDLLLRMEDLVMARVVAQQALGTLTVLVENRRQLQERTRFVLANALPLWHQQLALIRQEAETATSVAEATETLREALAGETEAAKATRPEPPELP